MGLSCGTWAEPEAKGSNSHGAVEDVRPLAEAGGYGTEALEHVDGSLDFIAALADRLVKAGGPTARATAASAIGPLVLAFRNRALNLPTSQIPAIPAGRVRLVATQTIGTGARMTVGWT